MDCEVRLPGPERVSREPRRGVREGVGGSDKVTITSLCRPLPSLAEFRVLRTLIFGAFALEGGETV